ncbi:alpha/beta fold hydrolase [Pseudomonas sp. UL073]|uniref:Alpha/beta fold hydrolase n=1 Tax=Zestomonas insulae TaxID=2809017 RepID=A0ABS2IBK3_9GAMM|nr:alpha/beta fold hydrolase [Pseudomonas insulae]MBM7059287.1 alpha/beta fold hydrolase [Pseudomonas insulae]
MLRVILLSLSFFASLASASPYTVLQRPAELDTGAGVLKGTLLLPKTEEQMPVALLIAGSGPTDRDGNNPLGGRNESLKRLAQALAAQGIASLRYDKRGVAASLAATPNERDLSVERYVDDAVAWSQQLRADPRFGPLILVGHSEGALIATLAAGRSGATALVSIAGSARPIDQVLREQLQARLPAPLLPRSEALIASLKAGHVDTQVPEALQVVFRPSVQPYLISLFRYDPAAAFASLSIPALIIQGTHDIQVGVPDAEALHAAKPDAELLLIAGMNHVLRIVPNDVQRQLASYNDPKLPLARQLLGGLIDFIKRNSTSPASS